MIAKVSSVGARGAVGLSSLQMAMGVRARVFEPRSLPWHDKRGREIGMGLAGGLGQAAHGFGRLVLLAGPALSEAAAPLLDGPDGPGGAELAPIPVILCIAEPGRPDDEQRPVAEWMAALADRTGLAIDVANSSLVREGQAGFATALGVAKALLDGGARAVLVGGVDSYYHRGVVEWLDRNHRLHALEAEDGFVPSEAAAFLLLERGKSERGASERGASERGASERGAFERGKGGGVGSIVYAEAAREPAGLGDDAAPNHAAVTTALLERAEAAAGGPIGWAITDLNGERHRQREWQMAQQRVLATDVEVTKWAWDTGDVGAAAGPLNAVLALTMLRLGLAPAERAVLSLASEGAERGVVVLVGAGPSGAGPSGAGPSVAGGKVAS
ncbi:MAG: hypothetical protein EXR75_06425 [Myxococcales bacterium]|nr:hypothetical protein [Myxococcales bacterium]